LPLVAAGAHVDVHLPGGLVRSYSLAGDPHERSNWTLGVLREVKGSGGSKAMHDSVRVGDMLTVGAPRNAFPMARGAAHTILLAGGIGITPLKAMAHEMAAQGASFELHYCSRSPRHAAFVDALQALVPAGQLHFHFDNGIPGQGLDITALLRRQADGAHLYYCGPLGFMQACADASAHWAPGSVHFEHFKAPEPPPKSAPDASFEVRLAKSGTTVQVLPDQTIVRAIELAGHRVPTSCLSGLCGSCKVDYLEGEVEHNDYILSDEEKTRCLTLCVSRSRSPTLVIDL
ncbi:2Fe-2S iron-sulfur cluster-binding protein, partial [Hydrogenophaga sp.]|uniref:PDR/VanB family oxidoreductase n=1 Tax=Hydrogenophaga sp. TaxID=1904254 RepID=UPI0035673D07